MSAVLDGPPSRPAWRHLGSLLPCAPADETPQLCVCFATASAPVTTVHEGRLAVTAHHQHQDPALECAHRIRPERPSARVCSEYARSPLSRTVDRNSPTGEDLLLI